MARRAKGNKGRGKAARRAAKPAAGAERPREPSRSDERPRTDSASPARAGHGGDRRRAWLAGPVVALALGAVAWAGWGESLDHPFVLDDFGSITSNPSIRSLSTALSPPRFDTVSARPVLNLSLAIDHALGAGSAPRRYRLTNVLLHLLTALVLFGLIRRTLTSPRLRARFGGDGPGEGHGAGEGGGGGRAAAWVAGAAALLWLAHPLQTAAVTYVIQRAEILVSLFYLLVLYCVARSHGIARSHGTAEAGEGPRATAWRVAAVACCALGMGCKEVMATAPLVALAYERVFFAGSLRGLLSRRWWLYGGLAASWLVIFGLLSSIDFIRRAPDQGVPPIAALDYALSQPRVLLHYLAVILWPSPLVFDYYDAMRAEGAAQIVPHAVALLALGAALLWALLRRSPAVGFGGLAFFVVLGPTSSVVPLGQFAADHRLYLASAAPIAMAVALGYLGWLRWRPGGPPGLARFAPPLALVGGLTVALVLATRARNEDYRSELSIWADTAAKVPRSARAQWSHGFELVKLERYPEAIAAMERALKLKPDHVHALLYLGRAQRLAGRKKEAIATLSRAIALYPKAALLYLARGDAYSDADRPIEALADYDAYLQMMPASVEARFSRGNVRAQLRRFAEAIADYDAVIAARPGHLGALNYRALAHLQLGQLARARADVVTIESLGGKPLPVVRQQLIAASRRGGR